MKEKKTMKMKRILESITSAKDKHYIKSKTDFWKNALGRNYQRGGLDTPKSMKKGAIGKRTENYTIAKTKAEKEAESRFEQNSLTKLKIPETKADPVKRGESFNDFVRRKRLV
jgi:hypothetical protein